MAEQGIFLVPTDYPAEFYADALDAGAGPAERQRQIALYQRFVKSSRDRVQRAMKLGVRIAFGSDEYYNAPGHTRGQSSLLTLQAYQDDGMSPLDVIRTATVNAADLLGWDKYLGTIEAGKFADIIAVEGDPLKDVKQLQRVRFVMKNGEVIKNTTVAPR
jgi:imidazolonepropionase-like amidohydrolase